MKHQRAKLRSGALKVFFLHYNLQFLGRAGFQKQINVALEGLPNKPVHDVLWKYRLLVQAVRLTQQLNTARNAVVIERRSMNSGRYKNTLQLDISSSTNIHFIGISNHQSFMPRALLRER